MILIKFLILEIKNYLINIKILLIQYLKNLFFFRFKKKK